MKRIISLLLMVVLVISCVGCSHQVIPEKNTEITTVIEDTTTQEQTDTDEDNTQEVTKAVEVLANSTVDLVNKGEDLSTDEIYEADLEQEKQLEEDGTVEQTNISYDGTNKVDPDGVKLLGKWQGLTYYAQNDTRWANVLYTVTGNKTQTIKSSGCGPTSAAMIVSSSKGAILPTTMAQLFVDKGFRTPENGTAWAAMSFVADYFDFKEFYTTTSYNKVFKYLSTDKNTDGVADYFVIAVCASGLWTTGGHYIAILRDDDKVLGVSDPYPYGGKYDTSSRRAANVIVSGNIAYVTEANFKKYSNVKKFFVFSNDHSSTKKPGIKVDYIRYIATENVELNVREKPSTKAKIVRTIKKGTKVKVTEVKGSWSRIGKNQWVSSAYLSSTPVDTTAISDKKTDKKKVVVTKKYTTVVGASYKTKKNITLYSKGTLKGKEYNYKKGTVVKVLSHYSGKVDYVEIVATGRKAYIKASLLNKKVTNSYKTVINKQYTFNKRTDLNSKGNFKGTTYTYVINTKVVVLGHYSKTIDKVKVIKTGRIAYVRVADLS